MAFKMEKIKIAKQHFKQLEHNLRDPKIAMKIIEPMLRDDILDHFNEGRGPYGPWRQLKHRKGKPLIDKGMSGGLMGSIRTRRERGAAIAFTKNHYASTHNFGARKGVYGKTKRGTPIPFGTIPQREFMYLSKIRRNEIKRVFGKVTIHEPFRTY